MHLKTVLMIYTYLFLYFVCEKRKEAFFPRICKSVSPFLHAMFRSTVEKTKRLELYFALEVFLDKVKSRESERAKHKTAKFSAKYTRHIDRKRKQQYNHHIHTVVSPSPFLVQLYNGSVKRRIELCFSHALYKNLVCIFIWPAQATGKKDEGFWYFWRK